MYQQTQQPEVERTPPQPTTDLLAEIEARLRQDKQATTDREAAQAALDQRATAIDTHMVELEARIAEILSANPEEFMIRFLQTEGE
jgi:hypothetical protein